jgi:hypothetical protein
MDKCDFDGKSQKRGFAFIWPFGHRGKLPKLALLILVKYYEARAA